MRHPHFVKDNKSAEYPQQCIWFDTETIIHDQWGVEHTVEQIKQRTFQLTGDKSELPVYTHTLNFGYARYLRKHHSKEWTDEHWLRFTSLSEYWDYVVSKVRRKTKLYLFCHNTSFDLPVLDVFRMLPSHGFTLRSAIIDGPPTILRFRNGDSTIIILDTLNIWRMPLKFLGKEIGLPKLDMPDNNSLGEDWESYARRDVEIISTACIEWWEYLQKNDYGSFSPTLAGQAMQVFRHKYMKHKIFLDDNPRAAKLTRSGYYGGRVECFRIGHFKQEFTALDFNSMYPAVMASEQYPCKLVGHTRYATLTDLICWLRQYSLTARVILRTTKAFAPVYLTNKLIFPTGEFECILSTPEIQYALANATIVAVKEIAIYDHAPLFKEMMEDMNAIKAEYKRAKDFVGEFLVKKLINSFYGKWGQSGGKWFEQELLTDLSCRKWIEYDIDTGKKTHFRQLGGLLQIKDTETESRESFPAIAAHVTAYARMKLWNAIELAGNNHVYYCDTDCVFVDNEGRDKLMSQIDDYRLGALKIVGEYDEMRLLGLKDYELHNKLKMKGVRKDAAWLDKDTVLQEQWTGLKGLVAINQTNAPRTKIIKKHLTRSYSKGVVLPSGVVVPFDLSLIADL